jgi:hypothetical protein
VCKEGTWCHHLSRADAVYTLFRTAQIKFTRQFNIPTKEGHPKVEPQADVLAAAFRPATAEMSIQT